MKHLFIIGGGSAAATAAFKAHEHGWRVTLANEGLPIGGTCLNVGCVPSKFFIRAAQVLHESRLPRFDAIVILRRKGHPHLAQCRHLWFSGDAHRRRFIRPHRDIPFPPARPHDFDRAGLQDREILRRVRGSRHVACPMM